MKIITILIFSFISFGLKCQNQKPNQVDTCFYQDSLNSIHSAFHERVAERKKLVNEIRDHHFFPVNDPRVLTAIEKVPRHFFVPDELKPYAYMNRPLPIGYSQTISQPFIVANMTQLLNPGPKDKILEIGTGSGYQAAVLAEFTPHIYSIEIVPELAQRARKLLDELGYTNVNIKTGDGYKGWPEFAPFDGIIVTCAPEDIPPALIEQLKPGGKIIIPVGSQNRTQMMVVVSKNKNGKITKQKKYPVRFVPMVKE